MQHSIAACPAQLSKQHCESFFFPEAGCDLHSRPTVYGSACDDRTRYGRNAHRRAVQWHYLLFDISTTLRAPADTQQWAPEHHLTLRTCLNQSISWILCSGRHYWTGDAAARAVNQSWQLPVCQRQASDSTSYTQPPNYTKPVPISYIFQVCYNVDIGIEPMRCSNYHRGFTSSALYLITEDGYAYLRP